MHLVTRLSFVDLCVTGSAAEWYVTGAALVPSYITGTSHFDDNKTQVRKVLNHPVLSIVVNHAYSMFLKLWCRERERDMGSQFLREKEREKEIEFYGHLSTAQGL